MLQMCKGASARSFRACLLVGTFFPEFVYVCVCWCVCVRERERERQREHVCVCLRERERTKNVERERDREVLCFYESIRVSREMGKKKGEQFVEKWGN